ncbi:hypothetical protein KEM52_003206 [Ascosphaera acerosa]|nr:hypothetical protein KEM52_003206 [Ascosphaera acerosa]
MQLVNSELYQKEAEARAKAIDETRRRKAQQRDEREMASVLSHVRASVNLRPRPQHLAAATTNTSTGAATIPAAAAATGTGTGTGAAAAYTITLHDIPFQVANGGSKLLRLSKDGGDTPRKVTVGGVQFVRSKTGNLHRLTAVVSKKYAHAMQGGAWVGGSRTHGVKKKNELCQRFTSSGTRCSFLIILMKE